MNKKPVSNSRDAFRSVIDALSDKNRPFPARYLHAFSDLEPENIQLLLNAWPDVTSGRKQALLEDLKDYSEDETRVSFDALGKALLTDPLPEVRILATRLLWQCEDRKLIPTYLAAIQTDPSPEARAASASALGLFVYLGELDQIPASRLHEVEEALIAATKDQTESSLVRRMALEALGSSSRNEVADLIKSAIHQKSPEWVVSALCAMGRSCDERWEKHILAHLRDSNDDIRLGAIEAAGEISLPGARQPLLDILYDEEDVEIRRQVITSLSEIGGEGVHAALQELLELEEDDEEIQYLEDALENLIFNESTGQLDMFNFDPDDQDL